MTRQTAAPTRPTAELALCDYRSLLEADPEAARDRLESLLLNVEALHLYRRLLAALDPGRRPAGGLREEERRLILLRGLRGANDEALLRLAIDPAALAELQFDVFAAEEGYWPARREAARRVPAAAEETRVEPVREDTVLSAETVMGHVPAKRRLKGGG
jgi:hypothetical protein